MGRNGNGVAVGDRIGKDKHSEDDGPSETIKPPSMEVETPKPKSPVVKYSRMRGSVGTSDDSDDPLSGMRMSMKLKKPSALEEEDTGPMSINANIGGGFAPKDIEIGGQIDVDNDIEGTGEAGGKNEMRLSKVSTDMDVSATIKNKLPRAVRVGGQTKDDEDDCDCCSDGDNVPYKLPNPLDELRRQKGLSSASIDVKAKGNANIKADMKVKGDAKAVIKYTHLRDSVGTSDDEEDPIASMRAKIPKQPGFNLQRTSIQEQDDLSADEHEREKGGLNIDLPSASITANLPSVGIKGGVDIGGALNISTDVKLPSVDLNTNTGSKKFGFMADSGSSSEDISTDVVSIKPPGIKMGGKMQTGDMDVDLPSSSVTGTLPSIGIKGGVEIGGDVDLSSKGKGTQMDVDLSLQTSVRGFADKVKYSKYGEDQDTSSEDEDALELMRGKIAKTKKDVKTDKEISISSAIKNGFDVSVY